MWNIAEWTGHRVLVGSSKRIVFVRFANNATATNAVSASLAHYGYSEIIGIATKHFITATASESLLQLEFVDGLDCAF